MVSYPKFKKTLILSLTLFKRVIIVFLITTILSVLSMRWVSPPTTSFMLQHNFSTWLNDKKNFKIRYQWVDLNKISIHAPIAVVAAEDQKFPVHWGFDRESIEEAWIERANGIRVRGASTISMQTARTVFLWPSRSLGRKITEAYFTLLIEALWSKERIMEVYLNTVDWGPHVLGIEAASRNYYKRSSASLTRSQSALLAAVLPNPHKWSPVKPNAYVLQRKAKILRDMMKISLPWKTQGRGSIR